jgi:hypothetical protein
MLVAGHGLTEECIVSVQTYLRLVDGEKLKLTGFSIYERPQDQGQRGLLLGMEWRDLDSATATRSS